MATIIKHKEIHDAKGRKTCLCKAVGKKVLLYRWKNVNCKTCLDLKEVGFNDKQLREIARRRLDK